MLVLGPWRDRRHRHACVKCYHSKDSRYFCVSSTRQLTRINSSTDITSCLPSFEPRKAQATRAGLGEEEQRPRHGSGGEGPERDP